MLKLAEALLLRSAWTAERALQVNRSVIGAMAAGRANQRFSLALRYWGWRKLFNFARVEAQLRLGRAKVWGYPYEWEIDTTNICQLKCPLCHTGLGTVHRDKGVMSFPMYQDIIQQIKDYCIWLSLYSWGEPFLNKDIAKFVACAHEANIATIMSSNLNKPLSSSMAEDLVRSGLDVLIISLDGTTQDVYEVYRVGGHLDRVLDNVKLLMEKRRELGSATPYLEWQYIVMKQNEAQIPEAKRMAADLGVDNIVFKRVDFPHGSDDESLTRKWLPLGEGWKDRENPLEKPYHEDGDRCWRLWRSAVVNWDGGYAPCCYLTDASDDFGSVKSNSIKSIWNNSHYQAARELFKKGPLPEQQVGCLTCSVYLGSKAAAQRDLSFKQVSVAPTPAGGFQPQGRATPETARQPAGSDGDD